MNDEGVVATSSPQEAFNSVFAIESDMSGLAATAVARGDHRMRQDALARLAVAAEGARRIWGSLLQFSAAELPMRHRFKEVFDLMCSRERALQELILRGDFTVGQMTNVSSLVDVTAEPLQELVSDLQWLNFVPAIHQFVHWLTEGVPGAGVKQFDAEEMNRWEAEKESNDA